MALVTNNISGSASNSSKIGITGSVIIGNAPGARFPTAGTDAVFFVSGSDASRSVFGGTTVVSGSLIADGNVQLGDSSNDTVTINASTVSIPNNLNFDSNTLYIDSVNNRIGIGKVPNVTFDVSGTLSAIGADQPSTIFNGDAFVSGAFGTDSYIQMKPVGPLRIPTNTTASYIYTSGSTNDLYFTQYSGPYTNTTRLRWLEGMLTTGLLHGGVLSTVTGSTTFSITSGSGIILSYNASLTTDPYPTINFVNWPAYVSQSLTYVTSSLITYIGINPAGGIIQQTSPFTLTTDSDYITIGRVLHQSGSVTNGSSTQPIVSYGTNHWQDDFTRAFGPLKVSGHILAASGSTLGITKTAGDSYVIGRNYANNPNNPNNISSANDTAVTVSKIYRAYVSGSTLRLDTGVNNAGYTTINPAQYNNNGTLASVGASDASIQRVYWYPNTVSRAFTVYYGSATYANPPGGTSALDVAQQNIASENFVEGENTAGAAILVGYIIALGSATNLSNTAQARFIQAGVSRGAGAGGGGGVAVGATTAAGLDTYVQFNDGGSTFGGDAEFTYNKTTNILTIGDVTVGDSGLISTAGTTATVFNTNATTVNFAGGASTAVNIGNSAGTNTISGKTKFSQGLSGSLTQLTDGTSYIIADGNMSAVTGSNGAITLTAIPSGTDKQIQFNDGGSTFGGNSNLTFTKATNALAVPNISVTALTASLTQGSVLFSGPSGVVTQDNTNFFWDDTNNYLGIGTTSPARPLHVSAAGGWRVSLTTSSTGFEFINLNSTAWRLNPVGTATDLEIFSNVTIPTNGTAGLGFNPSAGTTKDTLLYRSAIGVISLSGSAPGFLFNWLSTSTPTTAGHLGMNTSSGRPQAFISGTVRQLSHIDELVAGSTGQIQYNNGGSPGASSTLTFNSANNILTSLNVSATAVTASSIMAAASSVNLFNTTATTINFGGAATSAINIGNSLGTNTISGTIKAPQGLSGSLTKLTDGTSYLVAGTNVTITTASNGSVTITSTASGGGTTDDFFDSTTAGSVFTTGSFAFRGQESISSPSTKGSDTFFYVSGSTNVTGSTAKVSLFGGDVISSGSLSVGNGGTIVGNLTAINNLGVLGSLTVMSNGLIAGNATVSGSTTTNTLFVNTGNVVGAPGSGANVLSLLSSGNIVMKLDVNNDALGHKFEVQDYLGISQFFVGENGNAELSGSLVVTGSLTVSGSATLGIVSEVLSGSNAIGGTFVFDTTRQSIFYVNNATSNITANFTNVPTVDNRIISTTVILSQSATARIVSAVQIAGVASTINWANNVTPTGNSGKQDIFGFNLIRSGSAWKTLGQMTTYG
jgi:hypothetical protein